MHPDDGAKINAVGEIDMKNGHIRYVREKSGSETVDTIIHEIMHGVARMYGIFPDPEIEEVVVSKMATGFTTVMTDNQPLFAAFLKLVNE